MSHLTSTSQGRALQDETVRGLAATAPVLFAALLGVFILFGVGFAQPSTIHNAAHDSRHALTFPCH